MIEKLRTKQMAVFEADGLSIFERNKWDHSYGSPEDEGYASIQEGHLTGRLTIKDLVFTDYTLDFAPKGDKKELYECRTITNDEIRSAIQIISRLKQKIRFSSTQWEGAYNKLFDSIISYQDVKNSILSNDVNEKIFTLTNVVPSVLDAFNNEQINELPDIISKLLGDSRMCEIGAERCTCADDFDTTTVASAANNALKIIEKYPVRIIEQIKKQHPELYFREGTVEDYRTITIRDYLYILKKEYFGIFFPISALEYLVKDALANLGKQVATTTKGHFYDIIEEEDKDVNIELLLVISNGKPEFSYSTIGEAEKK